MSHSAENDAPMLRVNTCAQCRDWGKYERHEDHAPRVTPPGSSERRFLPHLCMGDHECPRVTSPEGGQS